MDNCYYKLEEFNLKFVNLYIMNWNYVNLEL